MSNSNLTLKVNSEDLVYFVKHLRFEAIALALLMIALTNNSGFSLWVLPLTFLFFDIGMIGYLKDPKTGALLYNLTHNLTIPTLLIVLGVLLTNDILSVIGFCWTFHIALDRALGFGLKNKKSFKHTHMGLIKRP